MICSKDMHVWLFQVEEEAFSGGIDPGNELLEKDCMKYPKRRYILKRIMLRPKVGRFESLASSLFFPLPTSHIMRTLFVLSSVVLLTIILSVSAHPHAQHVEHFRKVVLASCSIDTLTSAAFHTDKRHLDYAGEYGPSTMHQYLVHLISTSTDEDVARIETELQSTFKAYFPHHTFLLFATETVAHQARGVKGVEWVGAFHPEYKFVQHKDGINLLLIIFVFFSYFLSHCHYSDHSHGISVQLSVALVPKAFTMEQVQGISARWRRVLSAAAIEVSASTTEMIRIDVTGM